MEIMARGMKATRTIIRTTTREITRIKATIMGIMAQGITTRDLTATIIITIIVITVTIMGMVITMGTTMTMIRAITITVTIAIITMMTTIRAMAATIATRMATLAMIKETLVRFGLPIVQVAHRIKMDTILEKRYILMELISIQMRALTILSR
jgi:hypothetical protein